MPIWIATSNRTAVDWDTDLDGGVAQVDLFHIQRPADDSYELVFLFARAGQSVSDQRVAWAQSVESDDPVPAVFTPPTSGGGGSTGGGSGYAPDPSAQPDGKWLTTESGAYAFTDLDAVSKSGETAQDIEGSLAVSGGLSVGYGQQIQAYGPGGFVTGGPVEAASANIQGPVEAYRADVRDEVTVDGDPVLTAQHLKTLVAASTDFADFKIRVATQL